MNVFSSVGCWWLWKEPVLMSIVADVQSEITHARNCFSIDQQLGRWRFMICIVLRTHLSMMRCFKSLVSRGFRRSNLKANEISKGELKGQGKLNMRIIFLKYADAVYPKLSKLVLAWQNYSSPKLQRFFETHCMS